jgi:hypothetical protein
MFNISTSYWFGFQNGAPMKGSSDTHASYFKGGVYVHQDLINANTPLEPGHIIYLLADASNSNRPSAKKLTLPTFLDGGTVQAYHTAVHGGSQPWMVYEGNEAAGYGTYRNNVSLIRGSFEVEMSNYDSGGTYALGTKLTAEAGLVTDVASHTNARILGEVFKLTDAVSQTSPAKLWAMLNL